MVHCVYKLVYKLSVQITVSLKFLNDVKIVSVKPKVH